MSGNAETIDLLFVYGTLMSGAVSRLGTTQRARLARESTLIGPATVRGELYDMGRYPGLVMGPEANGTVNGELLRLAEPAATFRWLDPYESIDPRAPSASEYLRAIADVTREGGEVTRAHVYVYLRAVSPERRITSGDWLAHATAQKPAALTPSP